VNTPGCIRIVVIDDDPSVRESLQELLKTLGYLCTAFPSAELFLQSDGIAETACLILDVAMDGMSGPELQRNLSQRKLHIPIIFVTAQRDAALRSTLIAAGAVECLFKPFRAQELGAALAIALSGSASQP
jgi:FixJ family two-component response regulator